MIRLVVSGFVFSVALVGPLAQAQVDNRIFCAQVKTKVLAFAVGEKSEDRILNVDEEFIAIKPSMNKGEVLISDGLQRYWVKRPSVKLVKKASCQVPVKTLAVEPPASPWIVGVELSFVGRRSDSPYRQFITHIPDRNQVEGLQNPIITEVNAGQSQSFGLNVSRPWADDKRWRAGVKYTQNSFKMKAKVNPADSSPIRLDERSDASVSFEHNYWTLNGGVDFLYPCHLLPKASYVLSLVGELNYYSSPAEILVRTGSVFKATEKKIEAGPDGIEFRVLGRAGILYEGVRVDLELTQDVEMGIALGYEWAW